MIVNASDNVLAARQRRTVGQVKKRKLSLLLVTNLKNIHYLTGFRGSAGVLAVAEEAFRLWVDPRYALQAREQARGVTVVEERRGLIKAASSWINKQSLPDARARIRVGIEEGKLNYAAVGEIQRGGGKSISLVSAGDLIEELRAVKDFGEVEAIRRAGRISCESFEDIRGLIKPGIKEADLANELEYRMRQKGAEGPAFETIVAAGPRGAWPHAKASSNPLETGQFVIFDFGAIFQGYAADVTRTVYIGSPDRKARGLYNAVLGAQEAALDAIRPGVRGSEPDRAARRFLERLRLSRYFKHSTGHGVGLDIHERPRLAKGVRKRLLPGNVVTVEPGIYLEGLGGVRIEDTVLIGEEGTEILTASPKNEWIAGWE